MLKNMKEESYKLRKYKKEYVDKGLLNEKQLKSFEYIESHYNAFHNPENPNKKRQLPQDQLKFQI